MILNYRFYQSPNMAYRICHYNLYSMSYIRVSKINLHKSLIFEVKWLLVVMWDNSGHIFDLMTCWLGLKWSSPSVRSGFFVLTWISRYNDLIWPQDIQNVQLTCKHFLTTSFCFAEEVNIEIHTQVQAGIMEATCWVHQSLILHVQGPFNCRSLLKLM